MFKSIIYNDPAYTGPPPTEAGRVAMRREEVNATQDHKIKAIFFDLHGVLVDVEGWHRVAFLSALQDFGYKVPIPRSDPVWKIHGGTWAQLEYMDREGQIDTRQMWGIYNRKQEYTLEIIEKRCKPQARVIDVIRYAKSAGYRVAVVTNGSEFNSTKILKASGLYDYFEFIITRKDAEGKVKPHPRPYLEARYKMGLANKEALVIEDTPRGIMSAVNAQCRTWKLEKPEDLNVKNLIKVMHNFRCTL